MPDGDYVLPLRWSDDAGLDELTTYLTWLSRHVRVIVVDGSPAPLFARHAGAWQGIVCHVRPDRDLGFANGKVNGVVTGMRRATADLVVIADDDVRYDRDGLCSLLGLLGDAELVRPQNYFDPLPWHARWDTSRTLLNRSFGADYPGTFGIRRATFEAMGGYDGDTLFENLELIRTVRAYGGAERRAGDLYVRRLPPRAGRFWDQRVRQAYDEFAQPLRMASFLAILPGLLYALERRRYRAVITATVATVALTLPDLADSPPRIDTNLLVGRTAVRRRVAEIRCPWRSPREPTCRPSGPGSRSMTFRRLPYERAPACVISGDPPTSGVRSGSAAAGWSATSPVRPYTP